MSTTLHARLRAAIEEKLAIARAAAVLKPGVWIALTTHDGWEFTGHSHVRAQEETAEKSTSRPVAYNIADQLTLTRTAFNAKPEPAKVASHIAAHGPGWAIRQHEAALRTLNRHQRRRDVMILAPHVARPDNCWHCDTPSPCVHIEDLREAYGVPVDTEEEAVSKRYAIHICGGDFRPGPRDACPDSVHDWPLPAGYIDSFEVAEARLRRRWHNVPCPRCDLHGWRPGRIDPKTDHHRPVDTEEETN